MLAYPGPHSLRHPLRLARCAPDSDGGPYLAQTEPCSGQPPPQNAASRYLLTCADDGICMCASPKTFLAQQRLQQLPHIEAHGDEFLAEGSCGTRSVIAPLTPAGLLVHRLAIEACRDI